MSISETRDGRPLVYCFAGCSQDAVIGALKARGLWEGEAKVDPGYPGYLTKPHDSIRTKDDRDRIEYARDVWDKALDASGTLVETYLTSRKIRWPRGGFASLRYAPRLKHTPSKQELPAMVAALTDERHAIVAIQRTWLAPNGQGKACVTPQKMTVGPMGKAAVKFGDPAECLGLAEGIETALSARQLYQIPVWATLSANRLDQIKLPESARRLTIFADSGEVGMREACEAAQKYEDDGLTVDVIPPKVHFGDGLSDFNDAVRA